MNAPPKEFVEWWFLHGHEPGVACPMIYDDESDMVLGDYGGCSMSKLEVAEASWRAAVAAERARCAKIARRAATCSCGWLHDPQCLAEFGEHIAAEIEKGE